MNTKSKQKEQKNAKGKDNNPPVEEIIEEPPKEKPKNIERFIYISTYDDGILMGKLKKLFEDINQKAFNLESVKEVYTREISESEADNNEIDYISGFQLIDNSLRITILEGITGLAMQKIKENLPKTQLNSEKFKIFCDSNILFDKRIYSIFGLSMKLIKLQKNLLNILQTYDVYLKATRYREIYDCFQIFGSLLNASTMREISLAGLFPPAEHLLMLERKYGDLLTEQDITGVFKEKKVRKKILIKDIISSTSNTNTLNSSLSRKRIVSSGKNIDNENNFNNEITSVVNNNNNRKISKVHVSKSQMNLMDNKYIKNDNNEITNIHKMMLKKKTVSRNEEFEKYLKDKKLKHVSKSQIWNSNLEYLEKIKRKKPVFERFCKHCSEENALIESPNQILFCPAKKNYYEALTKIMREKYLKDKKHFYSYSDYSLALSFPMIERERNQKYFDYIENKSKWVNAKDFERYKQPEKEKYYFPKIKNIL